LSKHKTKAVFNAGAGNDTIIFNADSIAALAQIGTGNRARVDGGGNIDTLALDGGGLTLDLTNISNTRIQNIEEIDIIGSGNNTLILNLNDTCTCVENIHTAVTCQNVVAHTSNEYFIITSACEGVVVFIT
jgi:Ca2+-binding RTX toxin-like protein